MFATARADAQLTAKSPFMPPQGAAGSAPTAGAPLEFRAYLTTSEGTMYRIYDPAKKTGTWIKLNERNADFDVIAKQHDSEHKTLTIEHQGKTLTLAERESKVVSSGTAAQAMPPSVVPVQANVAPAVTQSVVLNPTPADEQRRLDAVAAEVARRRALREQATQQLNQGAAAQIAVPQPVQAAPQMQRGYPAVPQTRPGAPIPGNPNARQR